MKTFWGASVALLISIMIIGPLAARDLNDHLQRYFNKELQGART